MVSPVSRLSRLQRHYQLFDPAFYRRHNGLSRAYLGVLGYIHFRVLGETKGLDPSPLFNAAFVQRQRALAAQPLLDRPFTRYVDDPALWRSVDPHPSAFSMGEPFSPRRPDSCPLGLLRGTGLPWSDGDHPLVPATRRSLPVGTPKSPWPEGSLGIGLQGLAEDLGRAAAAGEFVVAGHFDVVVMAGDHHCPACAQYRVHNPAHVLRAAGLRVAVLYADDLPRIEAFDFSASLLLVSRPIWSVALRKFIEGQRSRGAHIAFECDDILFDFPHALGIQFDEEGRLATWNVNHHAEMCAAVLEDADSCVVPTSTLASVALARGPRAEYAVVAPSFLSADQMAAAQQNAPSRGGDAVTVAYSSGTWTHSADFASIVEPLAWMLEHHSNSVLQVNGLLDPSAYSQLRPFIAAGRVRCDPRVIRDWEGHLARLAGADINIVPLEVDNGFCQAKSEVRYLESGSVGVPTIASPTEAYRRAIRHGVTGMLADSRDEWIAALDLLVGDRRAREAMGDAARADVSERYSPTGEYAEALVAAMTSLVAGTTPAGAIGRDRRPAPVPEARLLDGILVPGSTGAGEWWGRDGVRRAAVRVDDVLARSPGPEGAIVVVASRADVVALSARPDLFADRDIAALAPALQESARAGASRVLLGLHGLDPQIFFPRSASGIRTAVVIDIPSSVGIERYGATVTEALRTLRDAATASLSCDEAVFICPGRSRGLPGDLKAIEGFESDIEFATVIRQATALVTLDEHGGSVAFSVALMVGTPALRARASEGGAGLRAAADLVDPQLRADLRMMCAALTSVAPGG